jgi:hypothetical protein
MRCPICGDISLVWLCQTEMLWCMECEAEVPEGLVEHQHLLDPVEEMVYA